MASAPGCGPPRGNCGFFKNVLAVGQGTTPNSSPAFGITSQLAWGRDEGRNWRQRCSFP